MRNLLVSLLLLLYTNSAFSDHKDLVSLSTTNYPPYFDESLPQGGVLTDLIRTAFIRSEMALNVTWLPFEKAEKYAKLSLKFDGIYSIWYTDERTEWAYYSDPILPNSLGFFIHKDSQLSAYWNMTYLKASAAKIGVVRGYLNPVELENADLNEVIANSDRLNIEALLRQRVDLIVIDKMVAESLINTYFSNQKDNLIWLDPPLEYKMQYLAIAKNAPNAKEKIAAFNRGLTQIKIDGTYQKIMKKHGFDWLLKAQNNWLHSDPK